MVQRQVVLYRASALAVMAFWQIDCSELKWYRSHWYQEQLSWLFMDSETLDGAGCRLPVILMYNLSLLFLVPMLWLLGGIPTLCLNFLTRSRYSDNVGHLLTDHWLAHVLKFPKKRNLAQHVQRVLSTRQVHQEACLRSLCPTLFIPYISSLGDITWLSMDSETMDIMYVLCVLAKLSLWSPSLLLCQASLLRERGMLNTNDFFLLDPLASRFSSVISLAVISNLSTLYLPWAWDPMTDQS